MASHTLTGTGEGGLHPDVGRCERITVQWASARFGVRPDTLRRGKAIVIKIGQGAKPGVGGHQPASKVTDVIRRTRRIPADPVRRGAPTDGPRGPAGVRRFWPEKESQGPAASRLGRHWGCRCRILVLAGRGGILRGPAPPT